jgi:hypothetical protein
MLSEDDTDSGMTEAELPSQQSVASTSQGSLSCPTLTPPSSQEQSSWEDLHEAGTWIRQGPHWVMEEEMSQVPTVPDVMDKAMIEPALIGPVFVGPALDWRKL